MINAVTVTNHLGESVTMELRFPERSGFLIRDVKGLDPVKATINTTDMVTSDGAIINSARANKRNIVFNLAYCWDIWSNVWNNRRRSYQYFPLKRRIRIEISTDGRLVETYGNVESNEVDIFSQQEGSVISVICPDAWLYSVDKNVLTFNNIQARFHFPFSNESLTEKLLIMGETQIDTSMRVNYQGDAPIGVVIYIHAVGPVQNLSILNIDTRESITINHDFLVALTGYGIVAGDDIVISTVKGNKYITLQRNGVILNILNSLDKNPDWFQLERGYNTFAYTADSGLVNLQFRIENRIAYEGI